MRTNLILLLLVGLASLVLAVPTSPAPTKTDVLLHAARASVSNPRVNDGVVGPQSVDGDDQALGESVIEGTNVDSALNATDLVDFNVTSLDTIASAAGAQVPGSVMICSKRKWFGDCYIINGWQSCHTGIRVGWLHSGMQWAGAVCWYFNDNHCDFKQGHFSIDSRAGDRVMPDFKDSNGLIRSIGCDGGSTSNVDFSGLVDSEHVEPRSANSIYAKTHQPEPAISVFLEPLGNSSDSDDDATKITPENLDSITEASLGTDSNTNDEVGYLQVCTEEDLKSCQTIKVWQQCAIIHGSIKSLIQNKGAICHYYKEDHCRAAPGTWYYELNSLVMTRTWTYMGQWSGVVKSIRCGPTYT